MIPNRNENWQPAQPAERANARRAQTDSMAQCARGLRASQGGGAAARRLRTPKKVPAICAGSAR
jgi:hypothetical protein